jgi:hypothetical protein
MATRRLVCIGLTALAMASPALADDKAPLDGTWGGAQDGVTAQVIVTGGQVIGFFWRGDYLDGTDARLSADGTALTFAFQGGTATLTRTGDGAAMLVIADAGKTTRLLLKRD